MLSLMLMRGRSTRWKRRREQRQAIRPAMTPGSKNSLKPSRRNISARTKAARKSGVADRPQDRLGWDRQRLDRRLRDRAAAPPRLPFRTPSSKLLQQEVLEPRRRFKASSTGGARVQSAAV